MIENYVPSEVNRLEAPSLVWLDQLTVQYHIRRGFGVTNVRTRVGRYLRRVNPEWTDVQVKQAVAELRSKSVQFTVCMTEAGDEGAVERVYTRGPSSCMSGGKAAHLHRHIRVGGEFYAPVRVFAHPENNLRLMYLTVGESIVARCWVNVKKKLHNRIYASTDAYASARLAMQAALKERGFSQDGDECMGGEKLLLVETDCGAIVCPYIDPDNIGVAVEEDCLVIGEDSYEANYETGCLYEYDLSVRTCECCSESVYEEDSHDTEDGYVCSDCFGAYYVPAGAYCRDVFLHVENAGELLDGAGESIGYVCPYNLPSGVELITAGAGSGYYTEDYVEDCDGVIWLPHAAESAGYWPHSDGIWYDYPEEQEDE